ncbi:MAG: HutD family protein [Planctomycetota bacterium]
MPTRVPRLTLVARAAQPEMPWRNKGGSTREIAAEPLGARAGDAFAWRVSVASVTRDGPFSMFPGVERTMWLLRGVGMELSVDGRNVRLDKPHAEVAFRGEEAVHARLLDGPTEDLNLMFDRMRVRGDGRIRRLPAGADWNMDVTPNVQVLLYVIDGSVTARAPGHEVVAQTGDALLLDEIETPCQWQIVPVQASTLLVARFSPRTATRHES